MKLELVEVQQYLHEVVEGNIAARAALREQGRSEFGIRAQGHPQQLRVDSAQRVLTALTLAHGLRTPQTKSHGEETHFKNKTSTSEIMQTSNGSHVGMGDMDLKLYHDIFWYLLR